jgi:hypothetical protein
MFFTYGEEEEEEEEEERSPAYCEIIDSRLYIGAFYRRIINYILICLIIPFVIFNLKF